MLGKRKQEEEHVRGDWRLQPSGHQQGSKESWGALCLWVADSSQPRPGLDVPRTLDSAIIVFTRFPVSWMKESFGERAICRNLRLWAKFFLTINKPVFRTAGLSRSPFPFFPPLAHTSRQQRRQTQYEGRGANFSLGYKIVSPWMPASARGLCKGRIFKRWTSGWMQMMIFFKDACRVKGLLGKTNNIFKKQNSRALLSIVILPVYYISFPSEQDFPWRLFREMRHVYLQWLWLIEFFCCFLNLGFAITPVLVTGQATFYRRVSLDSQSHTSWLGSDRRTSLHFRNHQRGE